MAIARDTAPITEDDATIEAILSDGHLPALLPALAIATGDMSFLRDDLKPTLASPPPPQGGLTPAQQAEARALAMGAIRTLRERGGEPLPVDAARDEPRIRAALEWMTGSSPQDAQAYLPLVLEELAITEEDPRAPQWQKPADRDFIVAVIGSGMSGILAGVRLGQAGVPYVILEKNADVGGTWLENTYPGARVDVSNAFYSYSFAQRVDWPKHYSTGQILLDYFRDCAIEFGVHPNIRFNTEVQSTTWDDQRQLWVLQLNTPDGPQTLEVQAVITAVGQLNRPKIPEIAGLESFAGPRFHSAQWQHAVDLANKRVAVIGTGASAAQFVPAIAHEVAELTVFQRTPNWLGNVPHYHDDVPDEQQWLFRHIPHYIHWYRLWLFWATVEGLLPAVRVDDAWEPQHRSVSPRNDQLRMLMSNYLEREFEGYPELLEKCIPQYPPGSKRILLDNGSWPRALKRDNVNLITEPIERITHTGVVTTDGTEHPADVLIYGTGFHASKFLMPIEITGRDGVSLHERWNGDARAYMGITVPGFPNFFMLYGPNTNIVVNGSIIYFSECEVHYVMESLRALLEGPYTSMECTPEAHDTYNDFIDAGNAKMAWGVSTVNSWYKNETGRVAQNWPYGLLEYWQQTRKPDREAYVWR